MKIPLSSGSAAGCFLLTVGWAAIAQDSSTERSLANQHAPPEAYIEGEELPYFGSQDPWDRRFFRDRASEGRGGQRHMLDLMEGRVDEVIAFCEKHLESNPDALEAWFSLAAAYCLADRVEDAEAAMVAALDGGMPFSRFMAGPKEFLKKLYQTNSFQTRLQVRGSILVHGPMVGSVTAYSARFWLRTFSEADVQVVVSRDRNSQDYIRSDTVRTHATDDFTAVTSVEGLKPDLRYNYNIVIDGKFEESQPEWKFRTPLESEKKGIVQIGFGGGAGYEPENERMWTTISDRSLDAFLFMGDNVYIDLPQRAGALHDYTYYRRQSRPEFRDLVASTPIYAIWDDHDCAMDDLFFGPFVDKPKWKRSMWELFRRNWVNPAYGLGEERPGCWFMFSLAGVDVFMLDGRYYRENFLKPKASMLGPHQKKWLFTNLMNSTAPFKVLASPVPWALDAKPYDSTGGPDDTWYGFQDERREIFNFLTEHNIEGVVLISADRHRSDVRINERDDDYPLHEFESSRLTNDGSHDHKGVTLFSYNELQSFGVLGFQTMSDDPEVSGTIVTIDGDVVYRLKLNRSQLRSGR